MKEERYVLGKDFNTKDWWVYDNATNTYVCSDSKENCERYIAERKNKLIAKEKNNGK